MVDNILQIYFNFNSLLSQIRPPPNLTYLSDLSLSQNYQHGSDLNTISLHST